MIGGLKSRFPTRAIEATGSLDRSIGMSGEKALIVLSHLTDNAIRHNAKRVRLEAVEDNGSIKMTVSNDGDPISEPNREKIFDAFFTTRRDTGGTGMGLSIVQAVMTSHGGSIRLLPSDRACVRASVPGGLSMRFQANGYRFASRKRVKQNPVKPAR